MGEEAVRDSALLWALLTILVAGGPMVMLVWSTSNALRRVARASPQIRLERDARSLSARWRNEARADPSDALHDTERFFTQLQAFADDPYYRFAGRVLIAHVVPRFHEPPNLILRRESSQVRFRRGLEKLYHALSEKQRRELYCAMSLLLHVVLLDEGTLDTKLPEHRGEQLLADLMRVASALRHDDELTALEVLRPWMNVQRLLELPTTYPVALFYLRDRLLAGGTDPNINRYVEPKRRAQIPDEQAGFIDTVVAMLRSEDFANLLTVMVNDVEKLTRQSRSRAA